MIKTSLLEPPEDKLLETEESLLKIKADNITKQVSQTRNELAKENKETLNKLNHNFLRYSIDAIKNRTELITIPLVKLYERLTTPDNTRRKNVFFIYS